MTDKTIPHADGCPAKRTETYTAEKSDGTAMIVARCIDCGGQRVKEA